MSKPMSNYIWKFRLWLVYHLVGDRSFVANVDVVGSIHLRKMVWGVSVVRDVSVFADEGARAAALARAKENSNGH